LVILENIEVDNEFPDHPDHKIQKMQFKSEDPGTSFQMTSPCIDEFQEQRENQESHIYYVSMPTMIDQNNAISSEYRPETAQTTSKIYENLVGETVGPKISDSKIASSQLMIPVISVTSASQSVNLTTETVTPESQLKIPANQSMISMVSVTPESQLVNLATESMISMVSVTPESQSVNPASESIIPKISVIPESQSVKGSVQKSGCQKKLCINRKIRNDLLLKQNKMLQDQIEKLKSKLRDLNHPVQESYNGLFSNGRIDEVISIVVYESL
jgi:hypothetical protein